VALVWRGCVVGVGLAWVWHGCGMGVAWVWHGCGMGVAWVWHGCGCGVKINFKILTAIAFTRPSKCLPRLFRV
jgi:hypothetical protein